MKKSVLLLLLTVATPAAAQQQLSLDEMLALRQNCGADVRKLCPGMKPRDGQIMNCMAGKRDQLSDTCRQTLQSISLPIPN